MKNSWLFFWTLILACFWTPVGLAQQIHRDGFAGRQPAWQRGTDNVRGEEKLHQLSELHAHNGTTSEHIQVIAPAAHADPAYLNYYYPTPDAPISEDLAASVWVKASRAGVTLGARIVLPRERNPDRPDEFMTTTITGTRLPFANRWYRLDLNRPMQLAKEQRQKLRLDLGRDVDFSGAFVDRLILNLYTGAGQLDVFIDDLEIGPVIRRNSESPDQSTDRPMNRFPGAVTGQNSPRSNPAHSSVGQRGYPVRLKGGRLTINDKPFFFQAIRHSGTPLKALSDAGFNTVWFDVDTPTSTIEEAVRHDLWIVPSLPLLDPNAELVGREDQDPDGFTSARTPEGLTRAVSRFLSGDAVLFWDLGGGRSSEQLDDVSLTARAIRAADPERPRGADVWDGFGGYSLNVELLGTHRWPLYSSLELADYRNWLRQRRLLAAGGNNFFWTWIQTHIPEHQAKLLHGEDLIRGSELGNEPVGPQPEQLRLLTYIALSSGCQGLGYWSDRFLADSHHGRDRLLALALLNLEIEMIKPILLSLTNAPDWIDTSHPHVKAAVLRGEDATLVLPVWLGPGSQYVPDQGAIQELVITVPQVPNGQLPWKISPGNVRSLRGGCERVINGLQVKVPEFDLTCAIVFTEDTSPLVVSWQDHARRHGMRAAQYSMDLAVEELRKVRHVHDQLTQVAAPVTGAQGLLDDAERRITMAQIAALDRNYSEAYLSAERATRSLRLLSRAHWEQATRHLDQPSASPYAVSYFTLPKHWAMHAELRDKRATPTVLAGNFEPTAATTAPNRPRPSTNVIPISAQETSSSGASKDPYSAQRQLQVKLDEKHEQTEAELRAMGWEVFSGSLDGMQGRIHFEDAAKLKDQVIPRSEPNRVLNPYAPTSTKRLVDQEDVRERPSLGTRVLALTVNSKVQLTPQGKPLPLPDALERTYLAVRTGWVKLPPGTLVRITGWMKIPGPIGASADGAMVFDSVGGEAMGVRQVAPTTDVRRGVTLIGWKRFQLYRRIPESGRIRLTLMLTGHGTAYFDDLKIEPLR